MQTYLIASPQEARPAAAQGCALAHAAYRIGQNSTLLRQSALLQAQGGLLLISDRGAPLIEDPAALCAAALRECARKSYSGVLLDFDEPPRQDRQCFAESLGRALAEKRKSLFLPVSYARSAADAFVLVETALSGGNLREHLQEHANRFGRRIALDMERIRMDFLLPSRKGIGIPLTADSLAALIRQESPSVFFSPELCARYFTYTRNGETHFVLFDDADTLKGKLRLGSEIGACAAFFVWSEIQDLAEGLFQ